MMTPFDYKYQNPLGFACLVLIRVTVTFIPLGIHILKKKRKKKLNSGTWKSSDAIVKVAY